MTVAVIDDDELITQLVERVMERMGFAHVYRIVQPMRFMDMIAEGLSGVHLVICDVNMPDADGHDILKAVRKSDPNIPFIMLTGDQSGDTVKRAVEGGVSAYVVKPINASTLIEKVSTVIERAYGIRV